MDGGADASRDPARRPPPFLALSIPGNCMFRRWGPRGVQLRARQSIISSLRPSSMLLLPGAERGGLSRKAWPVQNTKAVMFNYVHEPAEYVGH